MSIFDETPQPLTDRDFKAIALSKYEGGGQSLLRYLEQRIVKTIEAFVVADPNDAGAIAQLQARMHECVNVRDLIRVDEAVYNDEEEEE